MLKSILVVLILSLNLAFSFAQQKMSYSPLVVNYNSNQYGAGSQNWAISQDQSAVVYFCNNGGLLSFDGTRWELQRLKNNLLVRSIFIDSDGRIYVGSFEEFGYFEPDQYGDLQYTSLKDLVKDYNFTNDEIWQIKRHEDKVYFQTFGSYFIYDGQGVEGVRSSAAPLFFHQVGDKMYAQLINSGLAELSPAGEFRTIIDRSQVGNADVVSMVRHAGKTLLITTFNGIYEFESGEVQRWHSDVDESLKRGVVNRAIVMDDGTLVVGTINDGIFAIDAAGRELWHFNQSNGLINNTVLAIFADRSGNIWVGLDNGLALIRTNSPIYFFKPSQSNIGMIYDMTTNGSHSYLATNQGLFGWSGSSLGAIDGSYDQNWSVRNFDGQIFAGNNRATLELVGNRAVPVSGTEGGGNDMVRATIHGKELLIQASYTKLSIFERRNGRWVFRNLVDGFSDLIMQLEVDSDGTIWAAHRVRGLYRLSLDKSLTKVSGVKFYNNLEQTNEANRIKVCKLRGRIIFTCGGKFYRYNDIANQIISYDELNAQIAELGGVHTVVPVNDELYWFVTNSQYALVSAQAGQFRVVNHFDFTEFANPPIEEFGNIYVDHDGVSYFCMNGVVGRYNPQNQTPHGEANRLVIMGVETFNRKEGIVQKIPLASAVDIEYGSNNVTFHLMQTDFQNTNNVIEYQLEGFENQWEVAPKDLTKNYSYLPSGRYTFNARIVGESGEQLSIVSFRFTVAAAWYNSTLAIAIYVLLSIVLVLIVVNVVTRVMVARRRKLFEVEKQQQQQQLLEQKQQILELEKEKLSGDLTYKSKELASATMSLIATNEFLEQLKEDVLTAKTTNVTEKKTVNRIVGMINSKLTSKDEWGVYQNNFDLIHENFFQRLKEQYAQLTPTDLRLCALLRLNMPTKDIARMSGLTIRGVEAARYRLRKRLHLTEKDSLTEFLLSFK